MALAIAMLIVATAAVLRIRNGLRIAPPIVFEPTVVFAPIRLEGALVRGESRDWAVHRAGPLRLGDPVSVSVTAYCLRGLTRRDRYVREGIVAADPRFFPLARYVEIYVGRTYFGRFLIDDTGKRIKGNRLDIWTPTCSDARRFGQQRGTAVLVPRPRDLRGGGELSGRLGGRSQAPLP